VCILKQEPLCTVIVGVLPLQVVCVFEEKTVICPGKDLSGVRFTMTH
jgi:hypothetical protein